MSTTVKQLKKILSELPKEADGWEVVIYPKYSADKVDGFEKHSFKPQNVCEQHPMGEQLKNEPDRLKEYLGGRKPKRHDIEKHVAIIF